MSKEFDWGTPHRHGDTTPLGYKWVEVESEVVVQRPGEADPARRKVRETITTTELVVDPEQPEAIAAYKLRIGEVRAVLKEICEDERFTGYIGWLQRHLQEIIGRLSCLEKYHGQS